MRHRGRVLRESEVEHRAWVVSGVLVSMSVRVGPAFHVLCDLNILYV
jgi:hypothetical protein